MKTLLPPLALFVLTFLGCNGCGFLTSGIADSSLPPCKLVSNTDFGFVLMPTELPGERKIQGCTQNLVKGYQCCVYTTEDPEDDICVMVCASRDGKMKKERFSCSTGRPLASPEETL